MSESVGYENLIAGSQRHIVNRPGTVRVYEAFSRGELVGKLTSTGKWQELAFSALANFNEIGIATEAVDTTNGVETNSTFYVEGEFNKNAVIFNYGDTAATWIDTLAGYGIYLRDSVHTDGQG